MDVLQISMDIDEFIKSEKYNLAFIKLFKELQIYVDRFIPLYMLGVVVIIFCLFVYALS